METYHAFYSEKMDARYGHSIYEGLNGENVKVTAVSEKKERGLGWDDTVYLGLVKRNCLKPNERAFSWFEEDLLD